LEELQVEMGVANTEYRDALDQAGMFDLPRLQRGIEAKCVRGAIARAANGPGDRTGRRDSKGDNFAFELFAPVDHILRCVDTGRDSSPCRRQTKRPPPSKYTTRSRLDDTTSASNVIEHDPVTIPRSATNTVSIASPGSSRKTPLTTCRSSLPAWPARLCFAEPTSTQRSLTSPFYRLYPWEISFSQAPVHLAHPSGAVSYDS